MSFGYFTESVGVGAGNGPHDQYEVAGIGQTLDGILAILRGVADVVFFRFGNGREFGFERRDHFGGVVHGNRRLRHVTQVVGCAFKLKRVDCRY